MIVFETERLIARHWDAEKDADDAFAIYGDPDVMRFLGRNPQVVTSVEEMRERLSKTLQIYAGRNNGTGPWALEERETGAVVGAVLVKHLPDADGNQTQDLEIGWHLRQSAWGKGYATEAGRAGLQYAFDVLREPVVYAVVYADNTRSIAVTQRIGMTPLGPTDSYYGVRLELFEKRASSF
jgi:ribosomal-protein-alanine N-acetyltransferase